MNRKAVIAMSGGMDSTVAAYLAQKQGYVCEINSTSYTVILGSAYEFMKRELETAKFNWIAFKRPP